MGNQHHRWDPQTIPVCKTTPAHEASVRTYLTSVENPARRFKRYVLSVPSVSLKQCSFCALSLSSTPNIYVTKTSSS